MATISYAITACNEHVELERLLDVLGKHLRPEDEIVVQMDITATEEVKTLVASNKLISYFHPLNGDFATFKNNLSSLCTKDCIFQIDADEYPNEDLLINLPAILDNNPNVDVFLVPRINTVEGLTEAHIKQWGWRVSDSPEIIKERVFDLDNPQDLAEYNTLKKYQFIIEETQFS